MSHEVLVESIACVKFAVNYRLRFDQIMFLYLFYFACPSLCVSLVFVQNVSGIKVRSFSYVFYVAPRFGRFRRSFIVFVGLILRVLSLVRV